MVEIMEYLPSILSILVSVLAIVIVIVRGLLARSVEKTGADSESSQTLGAIENALNKALTMLPGLITFSESMNQGKGGIVKKEFVIQYLEQMFGMMNVEIDEDSKAVISKAIDDIVSATKQMHVPGNKGVLH